MKQDFEEHLAKIKDSSKYILEIPHLIENREFILQAVNLNGYVLKYLPEKFQHDIDFISSVLNFTSDISIINTKYFSHFEIALEFCNKNISNFPYLSDSLKDDKNFIIEITKKNPSIILFIKEELLLDKKFVNNLMLVNPKTYCYLTYEDKLNKHYIEQIINQNLIDVIPYIPSEIFNNIYEINDFIYLLENNHYLEKIVNKSSKIIQIVQNLNSNSIFNSFFKVKYINEIKEFFLHKYNKKIISVSDSDINQFLTDYRNLFMIYDLQNHFDKYILELEANVENQKNFEVLKF